MKIDNKFDVYNKQNKRGIHHLIFDIFAINIKLNALIMIERCNNLSQAK
jgi:hypothetical protein